MLHDAKQFLIDGEVHQNDVSVHQNMSCAIADTLRTQLGRSMLLAVDENGQLFAGVLELVSGEYDKYVNAVFTGENEQETIRLFLYFCRDYRNANERLLSGILRDESPDSETGFAVESAQLENVRKITVDEKAQQCNA